MLDGKRVAVVVPAFDEERLIGTTLSGIPPSSTGSSSSTTPPATRRPSARAPAGDPRVEVISHERNQGVGAASSRATAARSTTDRRHLRDGGRQPDGSRRSRSDRGTGRPRRGRLREGEPALHRPRLGADPAHALPRQRRAVAADEDRLRLLARRRLPVGLHGGRPLDARAARPRPHLSALRLSERHARAPERDQRPRARCPVATRLRRRRDARASACAACPRDLLAADEGVLLADAREVRDPRLPPARLLLRLRAPLLAARARARGRPSRSFVSSATS